MIGIQLTDNYLRSKGGEGIPVVIKDMIITYWCPPVSYYVVEGGHRRRAMKPWKRYEELPRWNMIMRED